MVDFHTHILPGIDDGCRNTDESLVLLKMQLSQGVKAVVMTPHFYPWHESPKDFLLRYNAAKNKLRQALSSEMPKIYYGSEVHYFEGMSSCGELKNLCIENTNLILIEMPMVKWSSRMIGELEKLDYRLGLKPVIAHIDRYFFFQKGTDNLDNLLQNGFIIQANTDFFIDKKTSSKAMRMLDKGQIHVLGSDCHDIKKRKPNLKQAFECIEKKLGHEEAETINLFSKSILKI